MKYKLQIPAIYVAATLKVQFTSSKIYIESYMKSKIQYMVWNTYRDVGNIFKHFLYSSWKTMKYNFIVHTSLLFLKYFSLIEEKKRCFWQLELTRI